MAKTPMTEAEAVAAFGRQLNDISARGRAPDSAERVAAILADNLRDCAASPVATRPRVESESAIR